MLAHAAAGIQLQQLAGGVLNSEAVTKKCVTLWVLLSFVFRELREKLLGMVCHFVGDL
jgi:hypothetical protein